MSKLTREEAIARAPLSATLRRKLEQEAESELVSVDKRPLAEVLQLPLWAEQERAAPNVFLRSALFRVVEKGTREYHRDIELPAWGTTKILYRGDTLDQADLDVALQCIHMARQGLPGGSVTFTDAGMLRALGRVYGAKTLIWMHQAMMRLRACIFTIINDDGASTTENLLLSYKTPRRGDMERSFALNPIIVPLFVDNEYTVLHWNSRLALKGQLAKWLHAFLCTHSSTARGVNLTTLRSLAGIAEARELRFFRRDLEKALAQLRALDDEQLGLVKATIEDGTDGPKLVWARQPNRRLAIHQGRRG